MYISDFRYHRPRTLREAVDLLATSSDGVLLAGGTDLLVDFKQGKRFHEDVIALAHLNELQVLELQENSLVIGSVVTHSRLVHSPIVQRQCPALHEAAVSIGTEQIRNAATVGGNVCTAASCADTAPILIALDARLELTGGSGRRKLPLVDFFQDHRKTALARGEILKRIVVPIPVPGMGAAFEKFGLRQAANISVASVAVAVSIVDQRCVSARLVMGAVAPTPQVSHTAAALLEGRSVSEITGDRELVEQVERAVADEAKPLDDIRGSAGFRRELAATLTRRALRRALGRAADSIDAGERQR